MKIDSALCRIAGSRDSALCGIARVESELHSAESQIKLFLKNENRLRAMSHSAEFFRIAGSRNKILSAFTEADKVTVFQKIGHR
jgi:hypothetical protein